LNFVKNVKLIIKIIVSIFPLIYFNFFFLKKKELLVSNNTGLVIDGFPRSGNTFCAVSFRKFQKKKIQISHHTHSPANIKRALKLNIPVILLIRKPEDSLKSLMIMFPYMSFSIISFWYYIFYRSLLLYRDKLLIIDFEILTKEYQLMLERYNKKFNSSLIVHKVTKQNEIEIFEEIKKIKNNNSDGIAIPQIDRTTKKAEFKINKNNFWFKKAEEIYLNLK